MRFVFSLLAIGLLQAYLHHDIAPTPQKIELEVAQKSEFKRRKQAKKQMTVVPSAYVGRQLLG